MKHTQTKINMPSDTHTQKENQKEGREKGKTGKSLGEWDGEDGGKI